MSPVSSANCHWEGQQPSNHIDSHGEKLFPFSVIVFLTEIMPNSIGVDRLIMLNFARRMRLHMTCMASGAPLQRLARSLKIHPLSHFWREYRSTTCSMLQHGSLVARSYDSATQQFQASSSTEGEAAQTGMLAPTRFNVQDANPSIGICSSVACML